MTNGPVCQRKNWMESSPDSGMSRVNQGLKTANKSIEILGNSEDSELANTHIVGQIHH